MCNEKWTNKWFSNQLELLPKQEWMQVLDIEKMESSSKINIKNHVYYS